MLKFGRKWKGRTGAFILRAMLVSGFVAGIFISLDASLAHAESLAQALQRTLATNPTINAEREKVLGVEETLNIAGANYRPSVTVNGDITHQNSHSDFGPGGESDDTNTARGYSVNINQPLYRGGRTVAAVSEADANIMAARQALRNVVQNILLEVATTYVGVVRDTAIRSLRNNNLRLLGEQLRATIDRQEAGVVTITDVALAQSRESAAKSELSLADANLRTSRAEYIRLTGRSPSRLHYPVLGGKLPAGNMGVAINIGKNENPSILAARYAEDASKFAIDQVRGERLPQLSLEAGFDQHWDPSQSVEEQRSANIRLRASVPLYQGGAVSARIRQAQARLRQSGLEISAANARVRSQIVSSWEGMIAARARIRSAGEQIRAAQKALSGIRSEESVGQRTVLDVLDAEQELLDAQVTAQQALGDHISTYYRLLTAMGRFQGRGLN
jgi:outer membrane protein